MAFGTNNRELKTYVNIFGGNLSIQAKEGEEGAISRENKNKKTVWEKHYPDLTGILESIEVNKNEHLKAWEYVVHLSDMGMHYYLSIPCESRYGENFAKKALNLKFGKDLTIKPFDFVDKDNKKRIGVSLLQDGHPERKVPMYFTKEDPKGLPVLLEKVDEEAYKIHNIQLNKFLREAVEAFAKPKDVPAENTAPPITNTPDGNDSLPF